MKELLPTQKLSDIAYARSGDKGYHVNIGVIAINQEGYGFLCKSLTKEKVKLFFKGLCKGEVIRYEWPGICALNFVLRNVLQEGAGSCMRTDSQGKVLGIALMEMKL